MKDPGKIEPESCGYCPKCGRHSFPFGACLMCGYSSGSAEELQFFIDAERETE